MSTRWFGEEGHYPASTNVGKGIHKSFVSLGKDTQETLGLVVNCNLLLESETGNTALRIYSGAHCLGDFESKG